MSDDREASGPARDRAGRRAVPLRAASGARAVEPALAPAGDATLPVGGGATGAPLYETEAPLPDGPVEEPTAQQASPLTSGEPGGRASAPARASVRGEGRGDGRGASRTPRRRARLSVRRVEPWSVFVLSLVVSLFLGLALVVAVGLLYTALAGLGVLDSVDSFARQLGVLDGDASLLGRGRVLGVAAVLAAVDVVLLTVLSTLLALLYNLCASFTGGFEVTLAEKE